MHRNNGLYHYYYIENHFLRLISDALQFVITFCAHGLLILIAWKMTRDARLVCPPVCHTPVWWSETENPTSKSSSVRAKNVSNQWREKPISSFRYPHQFFTHLRNRRPFSSTAHHPCHTKFTWNKLATKNSLSSNILPQPSKSILTPVSHFKKIVCQTHTLHTGTHSTDTEHTQRMPFSVPRRKTVCRRLMNAETSGSKCG